jgi:hypothetical protein
MMHSSYNRRTATKVRDGRVQKKNRHIPTCRLGLVLDRESPGKGYRHLVTKRDVQQFIDIIPDWDRLSQNLERIVLSRPVPSEDGAYEFFHREETGGIYLHAWQDDLWTELRVGYYEAHAEVFEHLGVSCDNLDKAVLCRFTEPRLRAFMLLHVFMHELGHHFDQMTQKHRNSTRGEDYAERFAASRFQVLLPEYIRVFGDPRRSC